MRYLSPFPVSFVAAISLTALTTLTPFATPAARADIITFVNLPGNNLDPFTTPYTEGNFTVTPSTGWAAAKIFGNPAPSVASNVAGTTSLTITANLGGTFQFNAFDFSSNTNNSAAYTITGSRNGNTLYSIPGTNLTTGFTTVTNPNNATLIDTLILSAIRNNASSYNIDNINVTPAAIGAPEPGTLALLAMGALPIAGIMARRRKSKNA